MDCTQGPTNPHWARVVSYDPFSLCEIFELIRIKLTAVREQLPFMQRVLITIDLNLTIFVSDLYSLNV
jgi:hypothetical protein